MWGAPTLRSAALTTAEVGSFVSFGFKGVSDKAIGRINQNVSALREICFYLSTYYCTTP